jgi:hypothetical protein
MTRKRTSENDLVVSGGGAAAPVRRKAAARPRAKRAAEPETLAAAPVEPETVAPQADAAYSVNTPSYQEIAALAYSYWEARGGHGGSPEEDWLRAEQELLARSSFATA